MLALSSFGFYRPTRDDFTVGPRDVTPTSSNNPFVAAGVAIVKPDKDAVVEQYNCAIVRFSNVQPTTRDLILITDTTLH